MSLENKFISRIDYGQLFIVLLLCSVSFLAIYSAEQDSAYVGSGFIMKQIFYYVSGLAIAFVVMQFDYKQLSKVVWYLYGLGVAMCAAVLFVGHSVNGATRWIKIKGFVIQPAEFMKVLLIMALAYVAHRHNKQYEVRSIKTDLLLIGKLVAVTLLPIVFVIKEDLGTSIIILSILAVILFVSGITWRLLVPMCTVAVIGIAGLLYLVFEKPQILKDYLGVEPFRLERLYSWQDPYASSSNTGYQLTKSLQAIGSGEATGKGLGEREVFLPEAHSDFIFSVIGEEYGFVGGSIVIVLFFMLIFIWIKIALETKLDFNSYLCTGIIGMFTFQVFQNIGMTIGLMPITGIPLPFLSYGGSSLWASMMALGLIFSVRYHHKVYLFSTSNE